MTSLFIVFALSMFGSPDFPCQTEDSVHVAVYSEASQDWVSGCTVLDDWWNSEVTRFAVALPSGEVGLVADYRCVGYSAQPLYGFPPVEPTDACLASVER